MWGILLKVVKLAGKAAWKYKGQIYKWAKRGWSASQIYRYGRKHHWW